MTEKIVVEEIEEIILIDEDNTSIVVHNEIIEIVEVAEQGPAGPPGLNGSGSDTVTSNRTTAAAISGHRVVKLLEDGTVDYADASDFDDASIVLGLTLGAAIMGASIQVREHGLVTEGSWTWTPGLPVWLGATGHLTQTPPVAPAAFSLAIGSAIAADTVFIRIEPVVLL